MECMRHLCAGLIVLVASLGYSAQERPNILLILADDLGAGELGCYGNAQHHTPHLDALAQGGVRFETCYAAPACSPSRVMLMTGKYGFRTGWCNMQERPGGPGYGPQAHFAKSHATFAQLARSAGYVTALAGKWQLPGTFPDRVHDSGFDEYMIWMLNSYLPPNIDYKGGFENGNPQIFARYFHPGVMRNNEHVATKPDDFGDDLFADFLIEFMTRKREEPFLAYFPMCLPHRPWGPTPDHPNLAMTDGAEQFTAYVEYVDKLVGRLITTLDEAGLRKNTVVLFSGDNGTEGRGKSTATELGARVPLIVNSPGRVRAGMVARELVDFSDFLPSLAEWAGASLADQGKLDGHSFVPLVEGRMHEKRDWIFSFLADTRVLRTERWLLEFNTPEDFGRLYDCGESRNGTGYLECTHLDSEEIQDARKQLTEILDSLPAPELSREQARAVYERMRKRERGEEAGEE